jgi:hypothetical protein
MRLEWCDEPSWRAREKRWQRQKKQLLQVQPVWLVPASPSDVSAAWQWLPLLLRLLLLCSISLVSDSADR